LGQTSHHWHCQWHTACMRQRAVPPGTGRCQKGACTGGLHSAAEACGVPHTVQFMRKMRSVCFAENRTHWAPHVPNVFDLPTGPKRFRILQSFRGIISNGYETRLTYPGTQGTVSTQSTPPHPRVKVTPAGRGPCELGWELRDQARRAVSSGCAGGAATGKCTANIPHHGRAIHPIFGCAGRF
jgi:hypothetical protein